MISIMVILHMAMKSIYDIQLQIGVAKLICHAVKLYDDRNNSR